MKIITLISSICLTFGLSSVSIAQDNRGPEKAEKKAYPIHWGEPPMVQTRDYRQLPGGYGMGSGTLAKWITENMEADKKNPERLKEYIAATKSEILLLEKEIADMKDFMTRARFTQEGLIEYKAKLKKKEDRLATLKMKVANAEKKAVPSFDEWVKAGKKLPEGMMFAGGTPWFNESTGKKRSAEEVYKIIYGKDAVTSNPVSTETDPQAKILDTSAETCKKLEVSTTYGGPTPTRIFYVFSDKQAILLVTIDNKNKDFPVSAKIHVFAEGVTQQGLDRWVNNQHSDGLYPDIPNPMKTHLVPAASCKAISNKLIDTNDVRNTTYENYNVEFQLKDIPVIDGIKVKDLTEKATVRVKKDKG